MRGKKDEVGNRRLPEPLKLTTGLVRWLGTCGGKVEEWRNPCSQGLVQSCIFAAFCNNAISQSFSAAFELENGSVRRGTKEEDQPRNDDILNGCVVGLRWTLETGLHIIPSAFQVNSIRRGGKRGLLIKHWCLQGSENGSRWVTLFVSEAALNGEKPVTIPLNPDDYKIWSGPLSGSLYTTALARELSHCEANLVKAGVCTPLEEETDFEPPSFRVFRIMDLTLTDKPKKMFVSGFDLFGTVKYVHYNVSQISLFVLSSL